MRLTADEKLTALSKAYFRARRYKGISRAPRILQAIERRCLLQGWGS